MQLEWKQDGAAVYALSGVANDEDALQYRFYRIGFANWANDSDHELKLRDAPERFWSLGDAKAWAEKDNAGWMRALADEEFEG